MGLLLTFLVMICVVSYFVNNKELLSPAFIFSLSFVYCGTWALAYKNKWGTEFGLNTGLVIGGGVLIYFIVTTLVRLRSTDGGNYIAPAPVKEIEIAQWKLWVFLAVCIVIVWGYIRALQETTGINSINKAILEYKLASLTGDSPYSLPHWVNYGRYMVMASGYWFAYIFARDIFVKRKEKIVILLIIGLSLFVYFLTGGRSGCINQLLAIVAIYMVFMMQKKQVGMFLSMRAFLLVAVIVVIGLYSFQSMGHLMGRTVKYNVFDYLAMYGGAQFHNLNLLITERLANITREPFGGQTFRNILTLFTGYYYYDLPFIHANGYFLGNVGTTFYGLVYDFGYTGAMVMTTVMAFVTQIVYEKTKQSSNKSNRVPLVVVFWGYIFSAIVFAFFSDWFYENIASLTFIQYAVYWVIFNLFFCETL